MMILRYVEEDGKDWVVYFRERIAERNEREKNGKDTAKLDKYIESVLWELASLADLAIGGWRMTEESTKEKYLRHLHYAREHFDTSNDEFWFLE